MQSLSLFRQDNTNKKASFLSTLLKSGKSEDRLAFQHDLYNRHFPQVYLMVLSHTSEPDEIVSNLFNTFFNKDLKVIDNATDDQIDQYFFKAVTSFLTQSTK